MSPEKGDAALQFCLKMRLLTNTGAAMTKHSDLNRMARLPSFGILKKVSRIAGGMPNIGNQIIRVINCELIGSDDGESARNEFLL